MIRIFKSRRIRWLGGVTYLLENVNEYWSLPGRAEERRQLGRRRQSRKDRSEIDLKAVEWEVMESIRLHLNAGQWRALEKVITNS